MAQLAVRRAGADDVAAVLQTIRAAFEGYRGALVPESGALRETEQGIAGRLRDGALFLAADGADDGADDGAGRAVGTVCATDGDGEVYLDRLAVVPEARRRGVAAALLAAVEAYARDRGATRVRLGVRLALTGNRRLFERLGYREIARSAHPGFAEPTSATYVKDL